MDLKRNKTFKVFITLIVIIFIISVISCKEVPAVVEEQQEEKGEVTIPFETKEETKPVEEPAVDSALEAILKEKVSFISEVLPGAELNTKTGELTAKAGNEWGIKEGEIIGCYVVKGFKMETADGVEKEQDTIGLIPKIIEALQKKIYEEKGEYPLPIPFDLKEVKGVKIDELKIKSGWCAGVSSFGMNIPVDSIIYTPFSLVSVTGGWGFNNNDLLTKNGTNDKSIHTSYESDANNSAQIYMDFAEGNIAANLNLKETIMFPLEGGKEMPVYIYEAPRLGEPFAVITGLAFLDETANKIEDWISFYEKPGKYQFNLLHFKNIVDKGQQKTIGILDLEANKETEKIKVFILPDFQRLPNEQAN